MMKHVIAVIFVECFALWVLGCRSEPPAQESKQPVQTIQPRLGEENKIPASSQNLAKPKPERQEVQAPDEYVVKLETTKGEIVINVKRKWAPKGADRFYNLVKQGYYNDAAFFRVLDGFMAQAGISGDPDMNDRWRAKRIEDDPVAESNKRGMVTFAMGGPNSRTTQFFINFDDNGRLDKDGFAPFGKVRDMAAVDKLYNGYGEGAPHGRGPSQARIQREGNEYLKKEFPELDYIKQATISEN
jgi:peptidyl-prolyl cis-trans isomerase A (cyclophilin A)